MASPQRDGVRYTTTTTTITTTTTTIAHGDVIEQSVKWGASHGGGDDAEHDSNGDGRSRSTDNSTNNNNNHTLDNNSTSSSTTSSSSSSTSTSNARLGGWYVCAVYEDPQYVRAGLPLPEARHPLCVVRCTRELILTVSDRQLEDHLRTLVSPDEPPEALFLREAPLDPDPFFRAWRAPFCRSRIVDLSATTTTIDSIVQGLLTYRVLYVVNCPLNYYELLQDVYDGFRAQFPVPADEGENHHARLQLPGVR